ncbi:MAG: hypothetical protein SangKO_050050 [Sandaracinaceae bacterium]
MHDCTILSRILLAIYDVGGGVVHIKIRDVLVVDRDPEWQLSAGRSLGERGVSVVAASSAAEMGGALEGRRFDAAVVDLRALPRGSGLAAVASLMTASPAPVTIVQGDELTPTEGFELARVGVRSLLDARPSPDLLWDIIARAVRTQPAIDAQVRSFVGHATMSDVVERVRELFLDQGLGLMRDDRSKTSRLLGVSRQAVQQMVRRRRYGGGESRP